MGREGRLVTQIIDFLFLGFYYVNEIRLSPRQASKKRSRNQLVDLISSTADCYIDRLLNSSPVAQRVSEVIIAVTTDLKSLSPSLQI